MLCALPAGAGVSYFRGEVNLRAQEKKKAEEERQKELNALFAMAIKQPKVPQGAARAGMQQHGRDHGKRQAACQQCSSCGSELARRRRAAQGRAARARAAGAPAPPALRIILVTVPFNAYYCAAGLFAMARPLCTPSLPLMHADVGPPKPKQYFLVGLFLTDWPP